MNPVLSTQDLQELLASPILVEEAGFVCGNNYLLVQLDTPVQDSAKPTLPACPIVAVPGSLASPWVDVETRSEQDLDKVIDTINQQPIAATTLVQLLRHNEQANVANGLLAESLAYSTLQHSSGFRAWLNSRNKAATHDDPQPLLIQRDDNTLNLTLNRPAVHNAYSVALRDALCEALQLAHSDPGIEQVHLRGNGPSYCAGGDLSEFGSADDAGLAHVSRTTRSAGALLASLPAHSSVHLHGACIGAGIEVSAFADHLVATPDAFFQLPEVAFGLVPGAGGTVSISKRIGKARTALMALSGEKVDAELALAWGLIDEIEKTK